MGSRTFSIVEYEEVDISRYGGLNIDELLAEFPHVPPNDAATVVSGGVKPKKEYGRSLSASDFGTDDEETPKIDKTDRSGTISTMRRFPSMPAGVELGRSPTASVTEDDVIFDLFCRACRGVLHADDRQRLYDHILTMPQGEAHRLQEKVHDVLSGAATNDKGKKAFMGMNMSTGKAKVCVAQASKHALDFGVGDGEAMLDTPLVDTLTLKNKTGKEKIKFKFIVPPKSTRFSLDIDPVEGVIKKDSAFSRKPPEVADVKVTLNVKSSGPLNMVIRMEVEDGPDHFFTINLRTEASPFAANPAELEMVEDHGYAVPAVLQQLRAALAANNGLQEEGIFRVGAEDGEVRRVKRMCAQGAIEGSREPHVYAALIKMWYRDLPTPVLNELPPKKILACDSQAECVVLVSQLSEPNKSLFLWLMDLLSETCQYSKQNSMNSQTLSICVGPNLYTAPSEGLGPSDFLRISQQSVNFVKQLLDYRIKNGPKAF
eukprot:Colp12_sorted_trinity150504_noHs@26641